MVGSVGSTGVVALGCHDLFLVSVALHMRFDADVDFNAVRVNLNGFEGTAIGL